MFSHFHLGDTYPAPKGVKDQKIDSSAASGQQAMSL